MKKYYLIISLSLIVILLLPVISLSALTNLRVLADSLIGGKGNNVYVYTGPIVSFDKYDFGNCTYWVSLLRYKIHEPIPNNWGNAITWAQRASKVGYLVNNVPTPGSILQDPNALGGLGHVAFVLSVTATNYTISEMNRIGYDEVDQRTLPIGTAIDYNFIHNKIN